MARVGQKVKLEALVGGIPRPDIYWLHNGKQFFPRDVKVIKSFIDVFFNFKDTYITFHLSFVNCT